MSTAAGNGGGGGGPAPKKRSSLLEIQAEQEREQQQKRPSSRQFRRIESTGSTNSRGSQNIGQSRRGAAKRPSNRDNGPIEQGTICSMKESFGFIRCADRPDELFFHYSEVIGIHPDELQMNDEVEFQVGPASTRGNNNNTGDSQKMAAYQLKQIPTGTITWETEDNPGVRVKGIVERPPADRRSGSGFSKGNSNNSAEEGTIRLFEEASTTGDVDNEEKTENEEPQEQTLVANGALVRFNISDLTPSGSGGDGASGSGGRVSRLCRGDLVECSVFTLRRTKQKFAKSITLLQSERERTRLAKEKKLLEAATYEEGVVKTLKNDFGFLRSNRRREDVYFHYSNVVVPEHSDEDFVLKEGQEMKFLVVTEVDNNKKAKCSARRIECLPKGSVVFSTVVARGVQGVVSQCPQAPSNTGHADSRDGTVRLVEPLHLSSDNGAIEEVSFRFEDAPGGVFSYQQRGSSVVGLWICEGDTLLFDVVQEMCDGSYRIAPTEHLVPPTVGSDGSTTPTIDASTAAVRLVSLSMVGRGEGVVHTIKDVGGYGFIHFAERNVDVHFKAYDVLPDSLQADLQRNMGYFPSPEGSDGSSFKMHAGASVQFDLSAHGTVSNSRGRGKGGGSGHERENLRGQRVFILPPTHSVVMEKVLASGVKGIVKSGDLKQLYAGFIDLEQEVAPMSIDERHPLISQMIDAFLEESAKPSGRKVLVFRDVWSMKEGDVVMEMVKAKGKGLLTCTHIPVPGLSPHPGRLCIRRTDENDDVSNANKSDDGMDEEAGATSAKKSKKKGSKSSNITTNKTLRFDKSNLVDDLKEDVPPGPGDVIICDVVQHRRTGKVLVQNMRIVERKERDPDEVELMSSTESGVGIVKEVVPNRNFGLINVLDETATKRELLFFHLSSVASGGSGSPKGHGKTFSKGDEVQFDIGVEKNGKQVAFNVKVLPKGTIPSKEAANACRGILLMEPSHTSLSDTPSRTRQGSHPGNDKAMGGGRWSQNKVESNKKSPKHKEIVEEGYILLTEDKSGMFARGRSKSPKRGTSPKRSTSPTRSLSPKRELSPKSRDQGEIEDEVKSQDGDVLTDDGTPKPNLERGGIAVLSHLTYKTGALAIHGAGAASCMDGSSHPRRGDLVSFVKSKNSKGVRDIRVVKRQAATLVRGRLEDIVRADRPLNGASEVKKNAGTAKFIAATEKEEGYTIDLAEVVSCDVAILKDKQAVEGILYNGKMYGICRTADLYLESKLGASHKERPKLNLTVKKDRGGTIMAQSMMAKGPDGTNGFAPGWTTRVSRFASSENGASDAADPANAPN